MSPEKLYMVVPCYNEQEVLPETSKQLKAKYTALMEQGLISRESRIVFVNDGSTDNTWELIIDLHRQDKTFAGIDLSRNRGHQNALLAGLLTVKDYADIVISMDADLQDDIGAIDEMIDRYLDGNDVVYGVRSQRDSDTWFKRTTAGCFYKVIRFLGADIIDNHADFRLMSQRALNGLAEFPEVNLFLRGLVPMIGYKSAIVYYKRQERFSGESKYPLKKMIFFAMQGITSLTVEPIRLITKLGLTVFIVSLFIMAFIIFQYLNGKTIVGWTSLICSVWLLGGLVLISIGTVGEYIGKIYLETKHRPRYIVREFLH